MADYQIEIELAEPLFCGAKHAVSNEMTSLEFIPGTSLRGSLAAELMFLGRETELSNWFSANGPLWTPAFPSLSENTRERLGDPDAFIVPMPLSLSREKRDADAFTGTFGVLNSILVDMPDDETEYQKVSGLTLAEKDHGQQKWTGLGARWLIVSKGRPKAVFTPEHAISMHVGLHYGRQANRDQALFSRRAIHRKTRFVAWVRDTAGAINDFPMSATIGKRTSAGNGSVLLRLRQAPFPWPGSGADEHPEATVQLITDAIYLDSGGQCLQGLTANHWEQILGLKVSVGAAASSSRRIRTWSNSWGLPREQTLAIAAGSVFRIKSAVGGGTEWKAALNRLAQAGFGRMRHEGFGWVAVNPSWLKEPFYAPEQLDAKEEERRRRHDPPPHPWPGLEQFDRRTLLEVFKKAQERTNFPKEKVGKLAAFAARVSHPSRVITQLDVLAGRGNPNDWQEMRKDIQELNSIEVVRFFLDGIKTLHG